jgi:hypothetical protein
MGIVQGKMKTRKPLNRQHFIAAFAHAERHGFAFARKPEMAIHGCG